MSKKAKSASKARRLTAKRAKKNAMHAKYESFARDGITKGSKRATLRGKRKVAFRVVSHPYGTCGNVGCIRCHGINFRPWLINGVPRGMPPKCYARWVEAGRPRQ